MSSLLEFAARTRVDYHRGNLKLEAPVLGRTEIATNDDSLVIKTETAETRIYPDAPPDKFVIDNSGHLTRELLENGQTTNLNVSALTRIRIVAAIIIGRIQE
jgi:hypothetical protein